MDSRKVQKIGYSTLSISLPSNWVKEVGLERGDTVFLESQEDGSLKLFPSSPIKPDEGAEKWICDSTLCDEPKMLERIIVGNYILGRDLLSISSSSLSLTLIDRFEIFISMISSFSISPIAPPAAASGET